MPLFSYDFFHIFYICLTWFTSNIPKLPQVDLTKMESLRAGFLPALLLCGHPYPEWKCCPIGRGSTCLPLLRRRRLQGGTAAGRLPSCCLTHGCVKQRLVPPGIPSHVCSVSTELLLFFFPPLATWIAVNGILVEVACFQHHEIFLF